MNEDVNDDETAADSSVEHAFLDLLDQDIAAHPERLQPITPDLTRRTHRTTNRLPIGNPTCSPRLATYCQRLYIDIGVCGQWGVPYPQAE